MSEIQLEDSWKQALADEFSSTYMQQLKSFLLERKANGATIFPAGSNFFRALDLTPLEDVKVVILGQDPYHGPGQAHGLSFSVRPGVRIPPSLLNIYKEIERDLGLPRPQHGFLENWAKQGVLLLNSVLTVEQGQAGAHQGKGWERFTDAVIEKINAQGNPTVFMLWGSYAQKKASFINQDRHLVLKAPHPSPLSAHRGFLGCGHFSKANAFLSAQGRDPIDWRLPEQVETS
ncbi:uracil-DNA glycosylase [Maritalea myrionectae]|uniref:Uracil-DNA glycosylase n=1 Tax=Maritalea myrionectae TaxID=454601 RepID=A0A2R4MH58_9HYPH|nr:uracil-DNA glycosylase [Maritalea myrionectae]AVX05407.1 uracil-DNA glycosylase [Maritalea myrionectae]